MWLWMWIGLSLITEADGFSSGFFPESCGSMSPEHAGLGAQTTPAPFEVTFTSGGPGASLTVTLQRTGSISFRGFLLEAREAGDLENGIAVGRFTLLDSANSQLMTCNGVAGSAVIQRNNQRKNLVQVQWTPLAGNQDVTFRATFVENFQTFWERVDSAPMTMTTTPAPEQTTTTRAPEQTTTTRVPEQTTTTRAPEQTTTQTNTTLTPNSVTTISTTEKNTADVITTSTAAQSPTTNAQNVGAGIMAGLSLFKAVQMEANNRAANTKNKRLSLVTKVVQILCCLLCTVADVAALVLFIVTDPFSATLIGLVCVALAMSLIELVMICVLLEPSHELKEIRHHTLNVISAINVIFIIAVIFVAVMVIEGCTVGESWLLEVMIVYTVLLSLFAIFTLFSGRRDNRRGDQKSRNRAVRKNQVFGWIALLLLLGITAFAIAVIIGFANGDIFCNVE